MNDKITSSYLHKLQAMYHEIDNRGICLDRAQLAAGLLVIEEKVKESLAIASQQWNCTVFVGAANDDGTADSVNLNATQGDKALLKKLKDLGYEIPKIPKKNADGDYEGKESTAELTLQRLLVRNQFGFAGGDPAIRAILKVRELGKIRSSYFNARFYDHPNGNLLYLSNYNCAGTITGRRSSRKHTFGFGNNAQNFPKHGEFASIFRAALISRPGNIFLSVDQKAAEAWPVYALAEDEAGIAGLVAGVNPHIKRASFVFNIPESNRTEKEWKDSMEYYLGKKIGHANNYGMRGNRMSDSLAQEGHSITPAQCQMLLDKANLAEPKIQGVFHKYVQQEIYKTRILRTPFGRERQFLGVRPNDANYTIFNEAYSYIPQSTVGDNTGFAVAYLESELPSGERAIVQEGHDSIVQDIPAFSDGIWYYLQQTIQAFSRRIIFHNGIEVEIPVEAELGFDFATSVKIKDLSYDGVVAALAKAMEYKEKITKIIDVNVTAVA